MSFVCGKHTLTK